VNEPGVLRFPDSGAFIAALPGSAVESVERRGKYIFCRLDGGEELVVHLGMTVTCAWWAAMRGRQAHPPAGGLDDGRELRFDDARRFGRVMLGSRALLVERRVLRLSVWSRSPATSPRASYALMRRTTRTVKAALLDQSGIAGLGNIYVDESCHLAGIRPTRRANRLTRKERAALHAAIRSVLSKAVANRGTTIDDYRDLWDARGSHQEELQVYGREENRACAAGDVAAHRGGGPDDRVLHELPAVTPGESGDWGTSSEWGLSQATVATPPRTRRGQQSCPTPVPPKTMCPVAARRAVPRMPEGLVVRLPTGMVRSACTLLNASPREPRRF